MVFPNWPPRQTMYKDPLRSASLMVQLRSGNNMGLRFPSQSMFMKSRNPFGSTRFSGRPIKSSLLSSPSMHMLIKSGPPQSLKRPQYSQSFLAQSQAFASQPQPFAAQKAPQSTIKLSSTSSSPSSTKATIKFQSPPPKTGDYVFEKVNVPVSFWEKFCFKKHFFYVFNL